MGSILIVLADAQPLIRDGLRLALHRENGIEVIAEASNGAEALLLGQVIRPAVMILDADLLRLDGDGLPTRLRETNPLLKLIAMFANPDRSALLELSGAGVTGFVSKSANPIEYLNAVRAVLGGGCYFSRSLLQVAMERSFAAVAVDAEFGLTARERQVLGLICGGYSNKDIARGLALSVRTVETHRLNIRKKTQAERLRDLVRVARQLGLDDSAMPRRSLAVELHPRAVSKAQTITG